MTKLKTFNREHVIRNTAPKLNNRQFKDRTGEKVGVRGGLATVTAFYGYHHGIPAWWCELDAEPGVFIFRTGTAIASNQLRNGLRVNREVEVKAPEENELALIRELGKVEIHGTVPQFAEGKIWVALKCFSRIDSRLYGRIYAAMNTMRGDHMRKMHSTPPQVGRYGKARAQDVHVSLPFLLERLSKPTPNYDKNWVAGKLGKGWDRVLELHNKYVLCKDKEEIQPEPEQKAEVSVEVHKEGEVTNYVDLLPYVKDEVSEMLKTHNIAGDDEMVDKLSRRIANRVFEKRELERKIMFREDDVNSVMTPEFKLEIVLGMLSQK